MKNILMICLLALGTAVFATPPTHQEPCPANAPQNKVTLDAGTLVIMELTEELNTEQATVGQQVSFRVKMHVKAEGEVAIKTGAMGIGRIKAITPATMNTEEIYRIEVTYVQAVDGQMVPVLGQELILNGKYTSQAATTESGKTVTAYVTNDIKIKT